METDGGEPTKAAQAETKATGQGKPTTAGKRTRTQTQDERQARGMKLRHDADEMLTDTELDTVHFMTLAEDAVRRAEEDDQVLEETVQQLKSQLKIHRSVLLMYQEAGSLTGFADPPHLETLKSMATDGQTWLIRVAKRKTLAALERGRREGRRPEPPTTPRDRADEDERKRRSGAGEEQGERGIRQGRAEPGDMTDRTDQEERRQRVEAGEERGEGSGRRRTDGAWSRGGPFEHCNGHARVDPGGQQSDARAKSPARAAGGSLGHRWRRTTGQWMAGVRGVRVAGDEVAARRPPTEHRAHAGGFPGSTDGLLPQPPTAMEYSTRPTSESAGSAQDVMRRGGLRRDGATVYGMAGGFPINGTSMRDGDRPEDPPAV